MNGIARLPGRIGRALAHPRQSYRRVHRSILYHRAPQLASWFRKRWALFKNPGADIRFGKHVYLGPGFSVHAPYGGTFIVGDAVQFRRQFRLELGADARVVIGSHSYLTYDVIISCDTTVEIGEHCGLGQSTYITDGSHRFRDLTKTFMEQGYDYRPIVISDHAQVHSKCTIVNSIGTRAIIGANAVVTKPIPPYTVAGGVPARVLDYFGPPGEEPPEGK